MGLLFTNFYIPRFIQRLWYLLRSFFTREILGRNVLEFQPPRLFALIIGINNYQSFNIPSLTGAVSDANAVQDYLQKHLAVPSPQIRNLRDSEATRAAILHAINSLTTDDRIQRGDPILIFYAGHGSTAPAPAGEVQLLVPYDNLCDNVKGGKIYGIPDRTLAELLGRLASVKGDNITIIFDCCYSGSRTRIDNAASLLVRGIDTEEEIPANLDQDINSRVMTGTGTFAHSLGFHCVFLAACGMAESAQERGGRGFFTRALLDVLVTCGTDNLTYNDLVRCIPILPGQNPQCEGFFQTRILFNSKAPGKDRVLYKIRRQGQQCIMDAGVVHGITEGTYFDVYQDRESTLNGTSLGTLVVLHTDSFTSTLDIITEASRSLPEEGYAVRTRVRFEEDLRIHVAPNVQLSLTQALAARDLQKEGFLHRILLVEKEKAELEFTLEEGRVVVNLLDSVVTTLGLTRIPFFIEPTADVVYSFIGAVSHFYWHLRQKGDTQALHKKFQVEFTEVLQSEEEYDDDLQPILYAVGPNLNHENIVDLHIQKGKMYGMKLVNNSDVALYPFLFFFDNSDFSIVSYYQPPTSDAGKVSTPLLPKSSVTIGYGAGGGIPYVYYLRDGQDIDVGYLKLFLFTQPVDLSHVPQNSAFAQVSPFAVRHNNETVGTIPTCQWDTILIPIIQREV